MAKKLSGDMSVGTFDIPATSTFARARLNGMTEEDAKQRDVVAAIGATARWAIAASTTGSFTPSTRRREEEKDNDQGREAFQTHSRAGTGGGPNAAPWRISLETCRD